MGRDDKQLEAEDDPVAARKNVTARLKESKEFSQSQTAQTMDLTEDRNPSTKLEYPDDAVDYPGDDEE